jgi:condensin complex subunit 3
MATFEVLFGGASKIFDQVQISVANHRKNSVALHKLHRSALQHAKKQGDASLQLKGERRFNGIFVDLVARILVLKKGVLPADRAVKFIGAYVTYIAEKGKHLFASIFTLLFD